MNRLWGVGRMAVAVIAAAGVTAASMPRAYGGTVVPTVRSAAEVVSPQAVAVDARTGYVFVTDSSTGSGVGGRVRMVDGATGAVLRTIAVGPSPRGVAVDARTGRVFVANWGRTYRDTGSVSVLAAATGAILRTVTVGANPSAVTVATTAGRVFVANLYSVSVLDATTGALIHTVTNSGGFFTPVAIDEQRGRAVVATYATTGSGQPAFGENDVSVLDATTGALQRRILVPHGPYAVAVDPRTGRLFTANIDGSVSIVDTHGSVRTVSVTSGSFLNAVTVDEQTGRVFVTGYHDQTFQGLVGMLDAHSGGVLRTMVVGGTAAGVAVDERTGRAFVVSGPTVSVLDAHSGRLVRTLTIPANSVTVDERRSRVFVTGGDGHTRMLDARSGTLFPNRGLRSQLTPPNRGRRGVLSCCSCPYRHLRCNDRRAAKVPAVYRLRLPPVVPYGRLLEWIGVEWSGAETPGRMASWQGSGQRSGRGRSDMGSSRGCCCACRSWPQRTRSRLPPACRSETQGRGRTPGPWWVTTRNAPIAARVPARSIHS